MNSNSSIDTKFSVRLQGHKLSSWVVHNCQIQIQNGGRRHFVFFSKRSNSADDWDIVTKFGKMDMDSAQRAVMPFLTFMKIQDGGRPPSWKN